MARQAVLQGMVAFSFRVRVAFIAGAVFALAALCAQVGLTRLEAQARRLRAGAPASERRVALVIGNAAYAGQPLRNPVNDAHAMAAALKESGFVVSVVTNTTFRDMSRAVDQFIDTLGSGDVALLYYSGHGIQVDGENFLLPTDFDAKDEADAKYVSYSASRLHDRMSGKGVRLKILVLDACRNNPFRLSRSMASGLAQMAVGQGSFVGLATGPGSTADDNPGGKNGLFTAALLEALEQPGLGLEQVFYAVRQRVHHASNGAQTPWSNSSVIGEFYFKPPPVETAAAAETAEAGTASRDELARREELLFWESIKDGRNAGWFQEYLTRYGGSGRFAIIAQAKLAELLPASRTSSSAPAPPSSLRIVGDTDAPPISPASLRRAGIVDVSDDVTAREPKTYVQGLTAAADSLMSGRLPAAGALRALWRNDAFKAADHKTTYVPFTLVVQPSRPGASRMALYWRVMPAGVRSGPTAYDDLTTFSVPATGQPYRVSRSFSVAPGDYDVYIVGRDVGEGSGATGSILELVQRVAVPDYGTGELATSSVILTSAIKQLPSPLTVDELRVRPYAFGTTEFVPSATTTFSTTEEMSSFFLVYGASSPDDRSPDVVVDFNFYAIDGQGGSKYFNRTSPVELNAQTLPPSFSFKAGHQLTAGQIVPMRSFAPGEYRLEITVTDRRRQAYVTRQVRFMVEP